MFKMSETARSISILKSTLPYVLFENLIEQLPQCRHLTKLHLKRIRLCHLPHLFLKDTEILSSSENTQNNNLNFQPKCNNLGFLLRKQFDIVGRTIANGIRRWGDSPPLQQLRLVNCGMVEEVCDEVLKSLSTCRNLTHLDFGGNTLGLVGKGLAELIKNLGVNPPLQQLRLNNCSIPEEVCSNILKSLPACQHLSHLDLSGNDVGNAGKHISEIIYNLPADPPLQMLCLENSLIPGQISNDILKALSVCRHLAHLNLSGLNVVKAKHNLVDLIKNLGSDSQLQRLYLQNCSLSQDVCDELLKCLSTCKYLTHLRLSGNSVGRTGEHLTEIIDRGTLEHLYLSDCRIPQEICKNLLAGLSRCECLFNLSLAGNSLSGALSAFHADSDSASPYLRKLHLKSTELNRDDISHIRTLIQTNRLPELGGPDELDGLWLQGNNLAEIQQELEFLLEDCLKEHSRELRIGLWDKSLYGVPNEMAEAM